MGYRICRGVVLGAEALPRYCEANGFSLETAEPQRILAGKFPEDIALLLSEAYHRLRGEKRELIVRSSAGEEDGRERSFAGVFESCLHIQSLLQLEEAVKRVWASFIAPDAAAYRSGRPQRRHGGDLPANALLRDIGRPVHPGSGQRAGSDPCGIYGGA